MNRHALAPDELDDLLAAFAIDALEPAEHEQVAAYVAEHVDAQREVDAYRRAVARLEDGAASGPRPEVWDRIAAQIEVEHTAPGVTSLDRHRQRRRARLLKVIAVAAAVVAMSGTAMALGAFEGRSDTPTATGPSTVREQADRAVANPDATVVAVTATDGAGITDLVVLPSGVGYILTTTLPVDVSDLVYGLYAVTDGGLVKLAVLDRGGPIAFRAPPGTTALVIATQARDVVGSTVTTGAVPASPSAANTPATSATVVPSGTPVLPITPPITLPIL